jgi:hypothetical protein
MTSSDTTTTTTSSDSLSTTSPTSIATNSTVSGTTRTSPASSSTSTVPLPSTTPDSPGPLQHFTTNGWLTPVVDPYQYGQQGINSPEGQAFILEMTAAYRDWVAAGSKGINGCVKMSIGWMWTMTLGAGLVLHWCL